MIINNYYTPSADNVLGNYWLMFLTRVCFAYNYNNNNIIHVYGGPQ